MFPCTFPIYGLLLSLLTIDARPISRWFKLVLRAFVCPLRSSVMDGSWHMNQGQIHYHLARAIMDLNDMAGTLPFFEPAINWEDSGPPPHHQTMLPPPPHHTHNRHLHTFVPMPSMPSSSSTPMVSYGGLPPPYRMGMPSNSLGMSAESDLSGRLR